MIKLLKRIRRFNNCLFTASLWGDGETFVACCNWCGEDGKIKNYLLEAENEEKAIELFVDIVQTLRKCSKYETY